MPQLQESQWFNASNQTDAKVSVGLPVFSSVSMYIYNTGFSYHDVFHRVDNNTMGVDLGKLIDKLDSKNFLAFGASVSLFSFNYASHGFSAGLSINDKLDFQFAYPNDFFKLLWYGNGHYIGQTLNIGNFGINATYYREYALHLSKRFGNLTIGLSPKMLFGKTNINSKTTSIQLYTDPSYYQLTATANMNVQMSGIPDSNDKKDGYFGADYIMNNKNKGYAIDLGAKYEITPKLSLSAGINDLGYINWTSNIHNYTAGPAAFTFDGFHAESFFQGNTDIVSSQNLTDSLKKLIKFAENNSSYATTLPYNFFTTVNYNTKHNLFGLQLSGTRFNDQIIYAGTLCYQLKLGNHFTGALSYTAKSTSTFNVGGAVILQFLNMQWYVATDNWWAAVTPLDSKNMNLRMGMNLVFGKNIKEEDKEEHFDGASKKDKFW